MFDNRNTGLNLGGLNNSSTKVNNNIGGLSLSKGMSLNLEKIVSLEEVEFGLGWIRNNKNSSNRFEFDLDATALILNTSGRVNDSRDVIFYNQQNTNRGVYSEGDEKIGADVQNQDCEVINVILDKVPNYCDSVKIVVTIHKANERRQNFGMADNAYIACRNKKTGEELARYTLTNEFAMDIAVEMGELRRTANGWEFIALGNGLGGQTLFDILSNHGVE